MTTTTNPRYIAGTPECDDRVLAVRAASAALLDPERVARLNAEGRTTFSCSCCSRSASLPTTSATRIGIKGKRKGNHTLVSDAHSETLMSERVRATMDLRPETAV